MQYPCPKPFLYDCKCPSYRQIVQTPHLTHYPTSGLLVIKDRIYLIDRPSCRGPHFLLSLFDTMTSGRSEILATVLFRRFRYERMISAVCANPNGSTELFNLRVCLSLGGIGIAVHIKRIQKWARTVLPARKRERRLALAMGLHPRLGSESVLHWVGEDVLGLLA